MNSEARDLNNLIFSIQTLRKDLVAQRAHSEKEIERTKERMAELDALLETLEKRKEKIGELSEKVKSAVGSNGD